MIQCPKCKSEIDNDSHYCDQCGQEIRYCSLCGHPGKGNRCTDCGGIMIDADSYFRMQQNNTRGLSQTERAMATVVTMASKQGIPQLFLVNNNLGVRLAAADGAIIGRRSGIYQTYLQTCSFVSGIHAQLNYNAMEEIWTITDKNSSNGTKVDGQPLIPEIPCVLHHGSFVQVANVEFIVEVVYK